MARCDVYANPAASERKHTPCPLDVQNDYIDALTTRVVVPLRTKAAFGPQARNLNPSFSVARHAAELDSAAVAAIPLAELRKPVASLRDERPTIQEALDTLFGAY
jgi:toxin CcdB